MSNHVSVEFSKLLTVPPQFGDAVKMSVGSPLMVVVDADELPPDSARKSLVTVMYANDMRRVHSVKVPWGLLCAWSPSEDSVMSNEGELAEEASFISTRAAVAQADMVARIAVVCDELRKSRDPASFFGLLRSSITDLIQSAAAELELPTVAVAGLSDDAADGSRVLAYQDDVADVRHSGTRSKGANVSVASDRVSPGCSCSYVLEPSDVPPARGTHVPPGYSYVSPGVVRSPDGTELSVGVATVSSVPDVVSSSFVPCVRL